jgi:hypothetical protein
MKPIGMPKMFLGLVSLILMFDYSVPEKGWGLDNPQTSNDNYLYLYCKNERKNRRNSTIYQCCLRKVDDCRNNCTSENGYETTTARDACKRRCNDAFNYCANKTTRLPVQPGFQAPPSGKVQQTPPPSPFKSQFNIQQFKFGGIRSRGVDNLPPPVIPDPIPPALPNFELEREKP